jgi:hypothetical protein
MGFSDNLTFEKAYPEYAIAPGQVFQTKSLFQLTSDFTISADGKLIEHRYRYDKDPEYLHPVTKFPLAKRVHIGDRVIEYHGDVLLTPINGGSTVQRTRRSLYEWTPGMDTPLRPIPGGKSQSVHRAGSQVGKHYPQTPVPSIRLASRQEGNVLVETYRPLVEWPIGRHQPCLQALGSGEVHTILQRVPDLN